VVHVEGLDPELFPVSYFFRDPSAMGEVDRAALALAHGAVLDVGACVGAHALPLARQGHAVTALDVLPQAVEILRARGVEDARLESVWTFAPEAPYDSVLALMNGTALAGTPGRLEALLRRLEELTAPHGQILLDSTDLGGEGELHYQLEFEGEKGAPFPQLFVGEVRLAAAARAAGLGMEVVAREGERYLARLTAPARGRV
jgi:hypothetical protein